MFYIFFFFIISLAVLISSICLLAKVIYSYVKNTNEFISYLESEKDYESLCEFGFYDKNLNRNWRRTTDRFGKIIDKYIKNEDIKYLLYADFIDGFEKKFGGLVFMIFLSSTLTAWFASLI